MKMVRLVLMAALCCGLSYAQITGAKITSTVISGDKVTVTMQNTSAQDITGYSLGLIATFADGHIDNSEHAYDYATANTGQALHPGESVDQVKAFTAPLREFKASVIVAIYADRTAEVTNERAFNDIVAIRQGIANAWQLSADALDRASTDPAPIARAKHELSKAIEDAKSGKVSAAPEFVRDALTVVETQATSGDDIRQNAAAFHQKATASTMYARITRLQ